jgi:serine/threonine-protein phosphatase 2A regulatory subunit B
LEDTSKPYIVVDNLGKQNIEDIKETITCSKMHPVSDSLFVFGTNKGSLKLGDLRQSSKVDNSALNFKVEASQQKNYIYEMISSYSSADFIKGGQYLVSRDFLTVKIWDICNTKKPVTIIPVQ